MLLFLFRGSLVPRRQGGAESLFLSLKYVSGRNGCIDPLAGHRWAERAEREVRINFPNATPPPPHRGGGSLEEEELPRSLLFVGRSNPLVLPSSLPPTSEIVIYSPTRDKLVSEAWCGHEGPFQMCKGDSDAPFHLIVSRRNTSIGASYRDQEVFRKQSRSTREETTHKQKTDRARKEM